MAKRKVDVIAEAETPTTTAKTATVGKLKAGREERDPCSNPELAAMLPQCNRRSKRDLSPTRGPRGDIYGPRDQD